MSIFDIFINQYGDKSEFFEFIFKNSPDMVLVNDLNGNLIYSNRLDMIGYEREDLEGIDVFSLVHPDDRKIIEKKLSNLQSKEFVNNFEFRYLHKKGYYVYLSSNATIIRSKSGEPIGILTSTQDITTRKNTEADLRKSQRYYKNLFQNMIDGFAYHRIILDGDKPIDYEFLDINDSFTQITGLTREQAIGKKVTEVIPGIESDPADWIGKYGEIAINQNSTYFEQHSYLLNKTFLVHVYSPEKMYFVTIFTDISERKKAEEDRLKLLKLESLSLLAGGIAHDYNNLLTSILGNVNLIQMNDLVSESESEFLKSIENATFRARDLTKQLLTFSKGGAPVTRHARLKTIIDESVSFCLIGSSSKAEITYGSEIPFVEVDVGQINQVFNNILINADQSMSKGGIININISTVCIPDQSELPLKEGEYAKIAFHDKGIGIQPDQLPHVFDPYYTTKPHGSGLGLATSYSIINRHNGHIQVNSIPGQGSTFTVYLPIAKKPKTSSKQSIKLDDKFTGKVLFMDDNEEIQLVVKKMLNKLGFTLDIANEGNKAFEIYRKSFIKNKNPYQFIILDLTIPGGLGGKETLKKIQKLDPNVKAIVSSGYSKDSVLSDYKEFGFTDILLKPFTFDQLKEVVSNVVGKN